MGWADVARTLDIRNIALLGSGFFLALVGICWLFILSHWHKSRPIMIVLGSGGHTAEMVALLRGTITLGPSRAGLSTFASTPRVYIHAKTDQHSANKAHMLELDLSRHIDGRDSSSADYKVVSIPRSREVGQGYITSIFTSINATLHAIILVLRHDPSVVLVNGPGTCVPISLAARILSWLRARSCKIIFVESICRACHLSLSGRLLQSLGIANKIFVQWPELLSGTNSKTCVYAGRVF